MRESKRILEPKHTVVFIFRFVLIVLSGFLVFGLAAVILLNKNIGPTYLEGISSLNYLQKLLPYTIFLTTFIQVLALCTLVLLAALLWSHSIAGPVFRFRRCLKELSQGKRLREPISFRATDQLHGLAQALSEMVTAQKEKTERAQTLLAEAQEIIELCAGLKKEGKLDPQDFNLRLKELAKVYLKIKEIYS